MDSPEPKPAPVPPLRLNMSHPAFIDGYMDGMDDPGFAKGIVPAVIPNKHPPGSVEHAHYAAGYETAIH